MEETLLDLFYEMRMDAIACKSTAYTKDYEEYEAELKDQLKQVLSLQTCQEQKFAIDELNNCHNMVTGEYGRINYMLGFKDALRLLAELVAVAGKKV